MKKVISIIFLISVQFTILGQANLKGSKSYMKIEDYRKKYHVKDIKLTKDNHFIRNNDTLIEAKEFNIDEYVVVNYEEKDSTFLETYKDVVYSKWSYQKNKSTKKMHLWKQEIKIYFGKNFNRKVKRELIKFAKTLNKEVDSLKISFVKNIEKSNYIIFEKNQKNSYSYDHRINESETDFYLTWNNKQQIFDCNLQIFTTKEEPLEAIITKSKIYFFKTLGFFSSSQKLPKNAYLSTDPTSPKTLTDIDLEILKYQYSYGICKFTDLQTFEENHKNAKEALKKGHLMNFLHEK